MKKIVFTLIANCFTMILVAQKQDTILLQPIEIKSVRAGEKHLLQRPTFLKKRSKK